METKYVQCAEQSGRKYPYPAPVWILSREGFHLVL
uniref:Uncharacterized protein n=1 Tax=Lotus japonicus TaxID=34305 RepID=I3SP34_LOTJA|nr:unknown [Lotus japonicus]